MRFGFYAGMILSYFKAAERAKKVGNNQKTLQLLKNAMWAGKKALNIGTESLNIDNEQRATVQSAISSAQELYQRELIAHVPEEDRELLMIGTYPLDQMIVMFEIAKGRLAKGREALGTIYEGDYVPAPLRNIMQPFLLGEATQEETAKRLDECMAKLRKLKCESCFP